MAGNAEASTPVFSVSSATSPQTLSSGASGPVAVTTSGASQVAGPVVYIGSEPTLGTTIEHVEDSPRSDDSNMSVEIQRAREETARLAHEAAAARLQRLEAEARSRRSSRRSATISSSPPVPEPELPLVGLPEMNISAPPMSGPWSWWRADRADQPAELQGDRSVDSGTPAVGSAQARIRELEERIAQIEKEKSAPKESNVPPRAVDLGGGVGTLDTLMSLDPIFRSAASSAPTNLDGLEFNTPRQSVDLIDLNSPPRVQERREQRATTAGQPVNAPFVDLLSLTPPRNVGHHDGVPTVGVDARESATSQRPVPDTAGHDRGPPGETRAGDGPDSGDRGGRDTRDSRLHRDLLLMMGTLHSKGINDEQVSQEARILGSKMDELGAILDGPDARQRATEVEAPPGLGPSGGPGGGPSPSNRPHARAETDLPPVQCDDKVIIKEKGSFKLMPYPATEKLTIWKQHLRDKVTTASGRSSKAFPWILQAEDMNVPDSDLLDSGEFASVDAELSAAFNDIARGRLGALIADEKERAAKEGRQLSGRYLYRLVLRQYSFNSKMGHQHDVCAFKSLTFPGDDHLEAFLDAWTEVVHNLHTHHPDEVLEQHLFDYLKKSNKLAAAIVRYKLAEQGHPDRTYHFLLRALTQFVNMEREDRNMSAIMDERTRRLSNIKAKPAMVASEVRDVEGPQSPPAPRREREESATAPSPAAPAQLKKQKKPCFGYREGNCTRGDKCPFAHDKVLNAQELKDLKSKRAKMPCRRFAEGTCKFGDSCQFSHDETAKAGVCTEVEENSTETEVTISAPARRSDDDGCLIVDTGTENHLISAQRCEREGLSPYRIEKPLRLMTANGIITADTRVDMKIPGINGTVSPLVMKDSVDALSVGRLVADGWDFHWEAGTDAYLVDRDGNKIVCPTRGYVPVIKPVEIDNATKQACMPCDDRGDADEREDPAGEDEPEESKDERLKREASSPEHLLCHFPKNPYCWVCGIANVMMKQARRITDPGRRIVTSAFGEHVCADHIVLMNDGAFGLEGERAALFILDMHCRFPAVVPLRNKTATEAFKALRYYLGDVVITKLYTDNSKELLLAAERLLDDQGHHGFHQTATPHRPQTNAFAERGILTVMRASRAALLQSGLPHRFWPWAAKHQSFAIAISPGSGGDPSPWWLLHGSDFPGWVLPFGALIHYRPPAQVQKALPKFAPRTIPGIFMGWHVEPGCKFRGDYYVLPISAFRVAGKREYVAHRIKELVHFDESVFPLQKAALDDMIKVGPLEDDGPEVMPKSADDILDEDGATEVYPENIDREYFDVLGEHPAPHMTFDEKLADIHRELFGDVSEEDGWGNLDLLHRDGLLEEGSEARDPVKEEDEEPEQENGEVEENGDDHGEDEEDEMEEAQEMEALVTHKNKKSKMLHVLGTSYFLEYSAGLVHTRTWLIYARIFNSPSSFQLF